MRLIDADTLINGRVENDPVRIAAECAPTVHINYISTHNPYMPFFDPGLRFDTYETADMENRLFILPCSIGEPIFVIPSLVNYKLNKLNHFEENNRVYKQIVCNVVFTKKDYLLNTCDGFCNVRGAEYGKTWFLLESQAEAALQAMKEGE